MSTEVTWKRPGQLRGALLILLLALLLGGCGSPDTATPTPTFTPTPITATPVPALAMAATALPGPAATASLSAAVAQAVLPSPTPTVPATPAVAASPSPCSRRGEWTGYTVQPGETLSQLAAETGSSIAAVMQANCLPDDRIIAGQLLDLPLLPERAPTPCAVPVGWSAYRIRQGDTLSVLAELTGSSVGELQAANCKSDDMLISGQAIYLPRRPQLPPSITAVAAEPSAAVSPVAAEPPSTPTFEPGATPPTPLPRLAVPLPEAPTLTPVPTPTPLSPFSQESWQPGPVLLAPDPDYWAQRSPCPAGDDKGFRIVPGSPGAEIEIGETRLFYACGAQGGLAGATVGVENGAGTQDLFVVDPVAVWSVLPGTPPGRYQIVMRDVQGNATDPLLLDVVPPRQSWIFAEPPVGRLGTPFLIYFVNYERGPLQASLGRTASPGNCSSAATVGLEPLVVDIGYQADGYSWGAVAAVSTADDAAACYIVETPGGVQAALIIVP